jgi:hypothetical protein
MLKRGKKFKCCEAAAGRVPIQPPLARLVDHFLFEDT